MTGRVTDVRRDVSLVDRCLAGDERAWATVVENYGALVWTVARRAGLGMEDARDVYQNVWRILVEELPRIRNKDSLGRWLARTAQFQSMRLIRGRMVARRALGRIPVAEAGGCRPDEELVALEDRRRVTVALGGLGERCRDLLRLLYYESPRPSYAQIAERMGMRIGSVGPTRARCLERIERLLEGADDDHGT